MASEERIEIARRYLAALVSHAAESVPLAEDVRRIEGGRVTVTGAEALRAILRREPVAATSGERWLVDGEDAVVFYDLEHDPARRDGGTSPSASWLPVYVGERFRVREGRIHEIEVVWFADASRGPRPARPAPAHAPPVRAAREALLAPCRAYLDALLSHEARGVPLAADAWRVENGRDTGASGPAIASALEAPVMKLVAGIDDLAWFVDADQAAAFYTLRFRAGDKAGTCRIAERFRVREGALTEVEAVVTSPVF